MRKSTVLTILVITIVFAQPLVAVSPVQVKNNLIASFSEAGSYQPITSIASFVYTAGLDLTNCVSDGFSGIYNYFNGHSNSGVEYLTVAPQTATIAAGQSQTFVARAYSRDGYGHNVSNLAGTVWSINSGVGTYVWTGSSVRVTAAGTWTVTATYRGKSATATLTVEPAVSRLDHITASMNPSNVEAPNTSAGEATAFDSFGNSWDVSTQATWSIPAGGDGGSWNQNIYTSNTAGTYTVQATYQCKSATASLTVTHAADQAYLDHITIAPKNSSVNAGIPQTYTATAYDTFGNSWPVTATYTCTNSSVITTGNSALSNQSGTYTITGSYEGKTDTATLTVTGHLATVISISVSPKTATIAAGTSQAFSATASDGYNTWDVTGTAVWSIDAAAGGSWNQSTGTYTSAIAGGWTVKATLGTLIDTANLTVNANPTQLNRIVISPKTASMPAGTQQTYTVTAYDLNNNSLGDVTSSTTFSASGATVTTNMVKTNNVGSYTVTANYKGLTDSAILTVTGYTAAFTETGLPSGTSWTIAIGSQNYTSTTNTITASNLSAITYIWNTSGSILNGQTMFKTTQTAGSLNVPSQLTQTLAYTTQYLVTYTTTGNALNVTAPPNQWVTSGSQALGQFPNQVVDNSQDTRCNFVSDNRPQTITAPTTIIGSYQTQYTLTVTSQYGIVSGAGWYDAGSSAAASLASATASGSAGTQYVFKAWEGDGSGTALTANILMTSPKTASTTWDTQYLVTYTATGNTLPVNGPSNEWVTAGAAAQGKFLQSVSDQAKDTQCLFQNDNRPLTITQPTTITGTYQTQYKVTFSQTGIASDADGPILSLQGKQVGWAQLAASVWAKAGSTLDFTYNSTVASTIGNKAYTLTTVNATSPLTVNQPVLIQGNYQAQYSLALSTFLIAVTATFTATIAAMLTLRYRAQKKKKNLNLTIAAPK